MAAVSLSGCSNVGHFNMDVSGIYSVLPKLNTLQTIQSFYSQHAFLRNLKTTRQKVHLHHLPHISVSTDISSVSMATEELRLLMRRWRVQIQVAATHTNFKSLIRMQVEDKL